MGHARIIIFDEANYKLYALAEASPAWEDEERALIDLKLLLGLFHLQAKSHP